MTEDFRRRDLIVNDRLEEYDGTTAVVRTAHLEAEDVEFLRWRAERWMKVRHMPGVLRHYPGFVLRHGPRDAGAHVPRQHLALGARTRERARRLQRYKARRAAEREYVPAPIPPFRSI